MHTLLEIRRELASSYELIAGAVKSMNGAMRHLLVPVAVLVILGSTLNVYGAACTLSGSQFLATEYGTNVTSSWSASEGSDYRAETRLANLNPSPIAAIKKRQRKAEDVEESRSQELIPRRSRANRRINAKTESASLPRSNDRAVQQPSFTGSASSIHNGEAGYEKDPSSTKRRKCHRVPGRLDGPRSLRSLQYDCSVSIDPVEILHSFPLRPY